MQLMQTPDSSLLLKKKELTVKGRQMKRLIRRLHPEAKANKMVL
jgi:hypothetical protein